MGHSQNSWESWQTKLGELTRTQGRQIMEPTAKGAVFGHSGLGCSEYFLKCLWMFVSLSRVKVLNGRNRVVKSRSSTLTRKNSWSFGFVRRWQTGETLPTASISVKTSCFIQSKGKALFHKLDVNSSRNISKSVQWDKYIHYPLPSLFRKQALSTSPQILDPRDTCLLEEFLFWIFYLPMTSF